MDDKRYHLTLTEGAPPLQIRAEVCLIGNDLVVTISGGAKPHVGAVAVGIPRPSLDDPDIVSATASVFAMIGHKEDDLARNMARVLAAKLNRTVVITVGIHVDKISAEEIGDIEGSCNRLLENLLEMIKKMWG